MKERFLYYNAINVLALTRNKANNVKNFSDIEHGKIEYMLST